MVENKDHSLTFQQTFSGYLKHPEGIALPDDIVLDSLIDKFPYAQVLHAIRAKCHNERDEFETYLSKAALYAPDRNVLYNIIHHPENFTVQPADNTSSDEPVGDDYEDYLTSASVNNSETEPLSPMMATDVSEEEVGFRADGAAAPSVISVERLPEEHSERRDEESQVVEEESIADFEPEKSADITDEQEESLAGESEVAAGEETGNAAEKPAKDTDRLIINNIASADYFRFQKKLDDQLIIQPETESANENTEKEPSLNAARGVSKYDDDKMPYTFLWWLNKTRKEHADTYQPYVSFKLDTTQDIRSDTSADLNQQIIENIFHLQSPLEDIAEKEQPKTVEFTLKRKDEQIIERFIREEPQIRPPKPEKLDNENKARKSSEDSYDMVSETLAQVYIEQMLFHKAIDTYKKLSLKFPEKSAYFADQIRKLETTH